MFVMTPDESSGNRERDRPVLKLPIQHHPAAIVTGQSSESLSSRDFQTEFPQQLARPNGVVVYLVNEVLVGAFTAGLQHEAVIRPDLRQLHPLRLAAKQAGRR